MWIFISFLFVLILYAFRNYWVFNVRIQVLYKDIRLYNKLPSYDYMMFKIWIWNVNKFIPKDFIDA